MSTKRDKNQYEKNIERLQAFDWSFADYSSAFESSIHNLHWYPAPFVPQIPSILIKSLTEPGAIVLDPFCGTGITGVEAAQLDRRHLQVDLNPQAIDIARAKFTAIRTLQLQDPERITSKVSALLDKKVVKEEPSDELRKWFHGKTLTQILQLKAIIDDWDDSNEQVVLKVVLSAILHRASSQPNHYSYIVDNCHPAELVEKDAFALWSQQLVKVAKSADDFRQSCFRNQVIWQLASRGVTTIGDARKLDFLPDQSVDIVVTSPPYVNVNDYVKAQRLTYLVYPPFPLEADRSEIGARRKRSRRTAVVDYLAEMQDCFKELDRVTKPNAFICLALGESSTTSSARVVDDIICRAASCFRSTPLLDKTRPIVFRKIQNRGIGTERLIVFKKE